MTSEKSKEILIKLNEVAEIFKTLEFKSEAAKQAYSFAGEYFKKAVAMVASAGMMEDLE